MSLGEYLITIGVGGMIVGLLVVIGATITILHERRKP